MIIPSQTSDAASAKSNRRRERRGTLDQNPHRCGGETSTRHALTAPIPVKTASDAARGAAFNRLDRSRSARQRSSDLRADRCAFTSPPSLSLSAHSGLWPFWRTKLPRPPLKRLLGPFGTLLAASGRAVTPSKERRAQGKPRDGRDTWIQIKCRPSAPSSRHWTSQAPAPSLQRRAGRLPLGDRPTQRHAEVLVWGAGGRCGGRGGQGPTAKGASIRWQAGPASRRETGEGGEWNGGQPGSLGAPCSRASLLSQAGRGAEALPQQLP